MKKSLGIASLVLTTSAHAGLVSITPSTLTWNNGVDIDGDGQLDFISSDLSANDITTLTDVGGLAVGGYILHTRQDLTKLHFGSTQNNMWTNFFVSAGTAIDSSVLFSQQADIYEEYFNSETSRHDVIGQDCGKFGCSPILAPIMTPWMPEPSLDSLNQSPLFDNRGLIGLVLNNGDGNNFYGWLDVEMTADHINIYDGAIETNANRSVIAGQSIEVPEPSTLAILATGLAMGGIVRRRRQTKSLHAQ
ncbi:PEP-CTERM sorting domain-containing protein [Catenovulum sediminis]|uniref:PEP-CTERM sorting domain-containing protein n=1 Tax=Catenovulum sediminis TaxID=1740262 RepID=A0ABV1RGD3_9ALTE